MKLLVIRYSALGDVAMTVPVIDSLARQYPDLKISILSQDFMAPLFALLPTNVTFMGVNQHDYNSFSGLCRIYKMLRREHFDAVADIHDVIRTRLLRPIFWRHSVKKAYINKGRVEKNTLCRKNNKKLVQLKTSFDRYAEVFNKLGWPVTINFQSIFGLGKGDTTLFKELATPIEGQQWIGFAPFAALRGKRLPIKTINEVIKLLCTDHNIHLFLFGGGKKEVQQLQKMAEGIPQVTTVAGRLNLTGELALMSHLHVMVSMDSANMHLASLVNIPVVSVWGATHPYSGFMGWRQSESLAVQTTLDCRPCSIYGNKPCLRGDYACLSEISALDIVRKVNSILANNHEKDSSQSKI
jgi:ADP-heptose:LPS heptosyltransferase